MRRRDFVTGTVAMAGVAMSGEGRAMAASARSRMKNYASVDVVTRAFQRAVDQLARRGHLLRVQAAGPQQPINRIPLLRGRLGVRKL